MKIDFIEKNVITSVFLNRLYAAGNIKASKDVETGVIQLLRNNHYEKSVYELIAGKGTFTKIKQYENQGKQHIIYRVRGEGFTYIDFELTKLNEQVGIADMYFYNSGENLSKSLAELAEKLVSHKDPEMEKIIAGRLNNLNRHLKNADYALAKKEFDALPYDMRNTRLYEFRYLDILSKLNQTEYEAFQKKIETKYAEDPGIQLMLIDVYTNQQKWDKAIRSIDQIDSAINKDPFLDYYRGLILKMKGDPEGAITHFEQLANADPKFAEVYPELIVLFGDRGNEEKAGLYFTAYKKLRNADEGMLEQLKTNYPVLE